MKRYLFLLMLAFITSAGAGQNKYTNYAEEGRIIQPRFLGSESFNKGELKAESLQVYLNKTLEYPQELSKCLIQGTEVVEFVVTADGTPTAFRVINSVCPVMDKEVIAAIKSTHGKWVPGTVNGKPADMKQEISVVYTTCSRKMYMNKVQKLAKKGNHLLYVRNNPLKALKYYNSAVTLLPKDASLLAARSLCRYSTGDASGAEEDWERIRLLRQRNQNAFPIELIAERAKSFPCYDEMMQALQ